MRKNKTLLSIIGLLTLLLVTIGITHAYFTANMTGGEEEATITVTGGTMNVVYNGGANINIGNIIPSDDPVATKTFTVTGNNTTDIEMAYQINLVVEENSFTQEALKYKMVSTNTDGNGTVVPSIDILTNIGTGSKTIKLGTGRFEVPTEGNKVHTYKLEIYFPNADYNQNEDQGKEIQAYIKIENYILPLELKDLILGVNNANVTSSLTIPGKAVSTTGEAVLASAEDDYGDSYYFRGAVKNNYVLFADMCWRIVRVTGDGSIKLILYNYNTGASSCSGTGGTNAFARYSGSTYTSAYNLSYNRNAYVGFIYGTPGSGNYATEHENITKSTILNNLETWYTDNLALYESELADTIWCNDKSTVSLGEYEALGYGTNQTGYSALKRMGYTESGWDYSTASPSLKCPNDTNDGKLSKFTVNDNTNGNANLTYKIGLLTIDEVAYAGGMQVGENSSYYINQNATGDHWWTLSPNVVLSSGDAYVWFVGPAGNLSSNTTNGMFGVRPAVSLKSTIQVTGNGTSADPYVVLL